ncbi:hypothetical protein [Actinomadura sp. NEAU-AAG7]|nr:hypothetical protein [Actinomadura sp. NEAU-AAG7]
MDTERDGFRVPAIVQFFYVRRTAGEQKLRARLALSGQRVDR